MAEFDITFKALAERLPRAVLELFGHRKIGNRTSFRVLKRELTVPLKSMDHACVVSDARGRWAEHFEAEVGFSSEDQQAILERNALLKIKLKTPVWTTVILMSKRRGPAKPVRQFGDRSGSLTWKLRPRYIQLWKFPAALFLELGNPRALPWVGATQATPEQMREAVDRIRAIPDKRVRTQLGAELVVLSTLQYDEEEVDRIRKRLAW
ncbi:MAG: hypothetical protein U0Q16_16975 [Bryobacteraceae bacterium]